MGIFYFRCIILFMIKRRKTRVIKVGNVKIGGNNPVSIQSMPTTDTRNTRKTISQIKELEKAGCEIIRIAVKDKDAAREIKKIKSKINIPLVADVHFDWQIAIEAIKSGADKIRINPGNISNKTHLKEIINLAKLKKIPIRIGLNSGSLPRGATFISLALKYIKLFEKENFRDIIISLKSSSVTETVEAYKKLRSKCNYPFHLGITAAGSHGAGIVKSSIGIGSLLLDGIGDTIRVSLTGDPVEEVKAAKRILQAVELRSFEPDVISCPMCGRCQVDLKSVVEKVEKEIKTKKLKKKSLTIAVMGCEVNGPGEARHADIGIAAGRGFGVLFKKGKVIKRVKEKDFAKEIINALD